MAWRRDELWFDVDDVWFREAPPTTASLLALHAPRFLEAVPATAPAFPARPRLTAEERRRAARRRKHATRTVPALALVVGSSVMLPMYLQRQGDVGKKPGPLEDDPLSQTFRL
ncbi:MAG: hypothetical protein FJW96_13860, partial [Actinobacteria bacterium]|nr:hypothetical protein [Actinomycetota bacterium]